MKRLIVFALALALVQGALFAGGGRQQPSSQTAAYHIGVVTGTVSQSEDDLRGAEELIRRYGKASEGGIIQHIIYPDNFMDQQETVITQISTLADDPLMKAVVVNQAIPGTTEAFKRIRSRRPDILLLSAEAHEDPLVISQAADLIVQNDFVSRGYTIVWAAKQLGADTFVHVSFPRHMSYESVSRRWAIFQAAAQDMGMKVAFETAPDPTSDIGIAGAQQYILDAVPQWVERHGKNAAYYCTNDGETEPLIRQLLAYGGIFVEPDLPSPLMGYPGALGIDLSAEAGNFPAILKKVEEAVIAKGGSGRFGTWAYSLGYTFSAGLGEFAKRVIEGTAQKDSSADLFAALGEFTPDAKWNGAAYVDASTGVRIRNHFLVYMDTYIFGKGYLPTTAQKIPEKYYNLKPQR
jgi:hypothetical protein